MSGWKNVALGDICKIVSGATPKRNVEDYWGGDIQWVTPKDISRIQGAWLFKTPERITEKGYKSCSAELLPAGSVLFSSRAPIGLVALVGEPMCTNQGFKSLVPSEHIHSEYLYYVMKHSAHKIAALGNGATFKEVSKATVSEFKIPLPPIEEQRRIAAILDKADAIRQKRKSALTLADTFLRATFLDMFGDPVTNPKGWDTKPLKELIDPDRPVTYGILKPGEDTPNGIPYIRVVDIAAGKILEDRLRKTSSEIAHQYRRSTLREDDLLISIRGHVGRMAKVPVSLVGANITQDTARLAVKGVSVDFMMYCLMSNSMQQYMARFIRGAAVKGINLGDLKELPIPVPEDGMQQVFSTLCKKHSSVIEGQLEIPKLSDTLFASLSQRAFKGEL